MSKPLAIDLFCGLGGWTEGLLAEGYDVIGFDIQRHEYGEHRYPAQLVVQDVLTLHGSQFRDAALIVASPPCQEYSYMAMPWTRAKAIAADYRSGRRDVKQLTALFDACFRIQREASEAAGRHVPLVVENVRGAIPWVGRSRWNFGSFHLWGDVPALMPVTFRNPLKNTGGSWFLPPEGRACRARNNPDGRRSGDAPWMEEGVKAPGMNWSDQTRRGQDFTGIAGKHALKTPDSHWTNLAERDGRKSQGGGADGWFGNYQAMKEGIKQHGSGREWFAGDGRISRMTSSGSPGRKMASAMIAKIPLTLSRHIARSWYPSMQREAA